MAFRVPARKEMAAKLKIDDPPARSIRRIIEGEIGSALQRLAAPRRSSDDAIHDVRKSLKRARAALRLLRGELGSHGYGIQNTLLRDAARPLTELRDARVLVDTLMDLRNDLDTDAQYQAYLAAHTGLRAHRRAIRIRLLKQTTSLKHTCRLLGDAQQACAAWRIDANGGSIISGDLASTYKRGYRASRSARCGETEQLHEWRKQAKYLWHQLQIVEPLWPAMLEPLARQCHRLTQWLGDDHDLAILQDLLSGNGGVAYGGAASLQALTPLIDTRRKSLQREACLLGTKIYGEKPRRFAARLENYWHAWQHGCSNGGGRH